MSISQADERTRLFPVPETTSPSASTTVLLDLPSTVVVGVGLVDDAVGTQICANDDVDRTLSKHGRALHPRHYPFWFLLISYTIVLFLNTANATALTTTYGAIAESLHAYHDAVTWLNAAYMIASSCTNPLIGRLATLFRPTSLFLSCTLLFAAGAALTGTAKNLQVFLLGRVVAGCGGAGLFTTANVLLVETAPLRYRGLLVGTLNSVITAGSSLGPVIAGALGGSAYGWRTAFLGQVPLCLVACMCIYTLSPNRHVQYSRYPLKRKVFLIDWLGITTLTIAIVYMLLATTASRFDVKHLAISLVCLVAFYLVERYVAELPIVPVRVLLHRATLFSSLSTTCIMGARWVVLFYAPIWTIAVLGFHPAKAGATLIPTSIGFAAGGLIVGWLGVKRTGTFYAQSLISIAGFSFTYAAFLWLPYKGVSQLTYIGLLVANGLGVGAILNYTLAHILATATEKALVAGLFTTFRGFSPSIGVGIAGGILQRNVENSLVHSISAHRGASGDALHMSPSDREFINRIKGSPVAVYQLPGGWRREAGILAYELAIKRIFWCALSAVFVGLVLEALTYSKTETPDSKEHHHAVSFAVASSDERRPVL